MAEVRSSPGSPEVTCRVAWRAPVRQLSGHCPLAAVPDPACGDAGALTIWSHKTKTVQTSLVILETLFESPNVSEAHEVVPLGGQHNCQVWPDPAKVHEVWPRLAIGCSHRCFDFEDIPGKGQALAGARPTLAADFGPHSRGACLTLDNLGPTLRCFGHLAKAELCQVFHPGLR